MIDPEHLSHAYIIVSPSLADRVSYAGRIAKTAVCTGSGARPCGECRHCRKVENGIHPDVITVSRLTDDRGKTRRELTVDQIRELSADAVIRPNEAERKVYIVEEAHLMNPSAQNAVLKLLEEPPGGVIFLLCAENAELLLPTVRSRCVELGCPAEEESFDEESVKLAKGYLSACSRGEEALLFQWCAKHADMDIPGMSAFLSCTLSLLNDMLCGRRDCPGMSRRRIYALTELMEKGLRYARFNVGVKHIMGLLAVESLKHRGYDFD